MMFLWRKFTQAILRLELFEVAGLTASLVALAVFIGASQRIDDVYGIHAFRFALLDEVVGMFQNLMPWLFVGTLVLFGAAYFVIRQWQPRWHETLLYLIRIMIAFTILMAIYKIANFYIAVFNPFDHDAVIQQVDKMLFFGKLPSEWIEPFIRRPLTWLFSVVYMSWFVLVYGTVLVMQLRGREAVRQYVSTALLTFYIGYFTYLLVPVIGPIFTVAYAHPVGGIAKMFSQDQALVARDCFPSLHTGISIVMAISIWRHNRKWSWFYTPMAVLIIVSTIYLRFHYALDVIAGASLAVAMTQLSPLYVHSWARLRDRYAQPALVPHGQSLPNEKLYTA